MSNAPQKSTYESISGATGREPPNTRLQAHRSATAEQSLAIPTFGAPEAVRARGINPSCSGP